MEFTLGVDAKILISLKAAGIVPADAMITFDNLVRQMHSCPPNFGPHKNTRHTQYKFNTWILRGYYPETSVFFRITLSHVTDHSKYEKDVLVGKVTVPQYTCAQQIHILNSSAAARINNQIVERELLGTDAPVGQYPLDKISLPKCISPKGMLPLKPPLKKIT